MKTRLLPRPVPLPDAGKGVGPGHVHAVL